MPETKLPDGVRPAPESAKAPAVRALATFTIGEGLIARVGETFRADDPRVVACPQNFIELPPGGLTDDEFGRAVRELERERVRARQAADTERRAREAAEDEKRRKKIAKRAEQIAKERERKEREREKAHADAFAEARKKREAPERDRERQAREQELDRLAWAESERILAERQDESRDKTKPITTGDAPRRSREGRPLGGFGEITRADFPNYDCDCDSEQHTCEMEAVLGQQQRGNDREDEQRCKPDNASRRLIQVEVSVREVAALAHRCERNGRRSTERWPEPPEHRAIGVKPPERFNAGPG